MLDWLKAFLFTRQKQILGDSASDPSEKCFFVQMIGSQVGTVNMDFVATPAEALQKLSDLVIHGMHLNYTVTARDPFEVRMVNAKQEWIVFRVVPMHATNEPCSIRYAHYFDFFLLEKPIPSVTGVN